MTEKFGSTRRPAPQGAESTIEPQLSVSVADLADHPELIEQVAELRWREWAYGQPLAPFVEVTRREAGRGRLPITVVAIEDEQAVGAAGLDLSDGELSVTERAGRAPWVVGVVVERDHRGDGAGRALLAELRRIALSLGCAHVWVATGEPAVEFYRRCGWQPIEVLDLESTSIRTTVLAIDLEAGQEPPRGGENGWSRAGDGE